MSEGANPADVKPVDPATPPAQEPKPGEETVTLTKAQHEQLQRDAARASSAQSRADRLARVAGRSQVRFNAAAAPPAAPTEAEKEANAIEEDRKAERGLTGIALDPKYRELLDADPTLRTLLTQNPLGVLPILAADALDAEDAVSLVKEKLDERLASFKKPAEQKPADPAKPTPAAPPAGAANAPAVDDKDALEAAKKDPNTERAIASMIKLGAKNMKK